MFGERYEKQSYLNSSSVSQEICDTHKHACRPFLVVSPEPAVRAPHTQPNCDYLSLFFDVDGPRFIDSAQCDAVRFVGVDDQSSRFRSQGQCIASRVPIGRLLWKCRRSARYGHRGERIGVAAHPGPSFLNFGRVRIPGSGSRFVPLTQVDTVEDVPPTSVRQKGWQVRTSGPQFMSQTRRQCPVWVAPQRIQKMMVILMWKTCSTPFWEKWMQVSKRSWPVQPLAQHSQVLILST